MGNIYIKACGLSAYIFQEYKFMFFKIFEGFLPSQLF